MMNYRIEKSHQRLLGLAECCHPVAGDDIKVVFGSIHSKVILSGPKESLPGESKGAKNKEYAIFWFNFGSGGSRNFLRGGGLRRRLLPGAGSLAALARRRPCAHGLH